MRKRHDGVRGDIGFDYVRCRLRSGSISSRHQAAKENGIVVAFKRLDHLVELTNKLGNKIEAATLHVIGKKAVEENRLNSKISTKCWNNHSFFNEPQGFYNHHPFVPPHRNTLEDTFQNYLQVSNQFLQANIKDDAVQTKTLEETLQAFMKEQAQINQDTKRDLQELKDALYRIESYLQNDIENENFSDSMTQYGENEIENPQMDEDDMFSDVEEDADVHKLKLDCALGLVVNTWKPFEQPPHELNPLPSNDTVQKDNLKSLPGARKYAHLKFNDDFP
ncbi:uncharacterized protein LOC133852620 [Alnus glutinosa]|uniref:uncharacterized protein LOC133852620 n=1 Tax=Alnus glutinosa TaxID=3517 RepID=UPI002D783BD3|nr:uncharacterized protein LOC133852620 [Alnus glutinosa]